MTRFQILHGMPPESFAPISDSDPYELWRIGCAGNLESPNERV